MHLSLAHRDPPTEEGRDEAAAASETERNPTTGLLLLPSTFLAIEAEELETHTTRHMRTLLSCKHKLAEHAIETAAQEDVNDEVVQEALYEYERCVCLVLHNPRFVDLGGYVARYIRGSSLHTSMRMGRCRTRRIRAIAGAMSARSACLGLSRWRESCLLLLLDIGLSIGILACL
jgi:hypothetical protein